MQCGMIPRTQKYLYNAPVYAILFSQKGEAERGLLFFEINEAYGKEVCDMLNKLGYQHITLKCDIYGKERMVYGAINC